jgi:hypothetical protein
MLDRPLAYAQLHQLPVGDHAVLTGGQRRKLAATWSTL